MPSDKVSVSEGFGVAVAPLAALAPAGRRVGAVPFALPFGASGAAADDAQAQRASLKFNAPLKPVGGVDEGDACEGS